MRVVVAGATGLVGSRTVVRLRDHEVEVVPLSHRDHSDAAAERDLARALRGADIVVDVTDAPSPAEPLSLQFFRTSTTALLAAAERAGAEHHVVLSFVGAERLLSGWFRAKLLLEDQVRRSPVPHSIVRAALSFECVEAMARQNAHRDGEVRHDVPRVARATVTASAPPATAAHRRPRGGHRPRVPLRGRRPPRPTPRQEGSHERPGAVRALPPGRRVRPAARP